MIKEINRRLVADLDEGQREALGDLNEVVRVLESYTLPEPDSEQRARLLEMLKHHLSRSVDLPKRNWSWWYRLMQSQWSMFETSFWVAGLFVLLLGLLMTLLEGNELLPLLLLVLSPLMAVGSVVYLFRPETRTLHELELLTATHPVELLIARLTMVLGWNMLIAFILMLIIHLESTQIVLWRLALAWLGPLLTLSGLALYITLRWGVLPGTILPLSLWGGMVILGWREILLRSTEGILNPSWLTWLITSSKVVLVGSGVLILLGLLLFLLVWKTITDERYAWN
ncbi:hypothetical protein ATHL_01204 [Anaerolinea thermolimosa]|uniref:hypothetical protein n=1 Tax=Anaerolinea thermolimosa TaxID=229919 RepID=UPI0007817E5B|nr:hypothetical protein [Anaerolinea thermolimosa]GAP06350.1 hypothetical protein ATHL_01204 [Anaerolinea thermolimosa]